MKKNTVSRNGTKSSAPWPPIDGRATLSRMNRTSASNAFMNAPAAHRPLGDVPGQRDHDQHDQGRRDQLHHHEPGDLEVITPGQNRGPAARRPCPTPVRWWGGPSRVRGDCVLQPWSAGPDSDALDSSDVDFDRPPRGLGFLSGDRPGGGPCRRRTRRRRRGSSAADPVPSRRSRYPPSRAGSANSRPMEVTRVAQRTPSETSDCGTGRPKVTIPPRRRPGRPDPAAVVWEFSDDPRPRGRPVIPAQSPCQQPAR